MNNHLLNDYKKEEDSFRASALEFLKERNTNYKKAMDLGNKIWKPISPQKDEYNAGIFTVNRQNMSMDGTSKTLNVSRISSPDWVNAIVLDIDTKKFVVIKEPRHGMENVVYEMPSGTIENNENPVDAAIREVKEECGYANALVLNELYVCNPNPAFMNNLMFSYLIAVWGKSKQNLDDTEHIQVKLVDENFLRQCDSTHFFGAMQQLAITKYLFSGKIAPIETLSNILKGED